MSLVTSLALDLPKLMTFEPPPCIWFIRKKNSRTMIAMGSRVTSRVTRTLCCGLISLKPSAGGFWRSCEAM